MKDIIFILIALGVCLILLQLYWEINMRTDDKYIAKKSSVKIEEEFEVKRREGILNWFYIISLGVRKFIRKRLLLKIGAILICIGIILKIIF